MKFKKFVEKLNKEIDEITPEMGEELKSVNIVKREQLNGNSSVAFDNHKEKSTFKNFFTIRRLTAVFSILALSFVAVFGIIHFANMPLKTTGKMIYTIDINPSISLLADENNNVEKVVSNNYDGDIMLSDSNFISSLSGKNIESAVKIITEYAHELGYISNDKDGSNGVYNKVEINCVGNTKINSEKLNNLKNSLIENFKNMGIYVYVNVDGNSSENLKNKVEEIKNTSVLYYEKIKDDIDNLRLYKQQMFYKYCDNSLESALNEYYLYCEIDELNKKIKNHKDNINKDSYWQIKGSESGELAVLIKEMEDKLEKLYNLYQVDLRNTDIIILDKNEIAVKTYLFNHSGVNIEKLENINKNGIKKENFSDIEFVKDYLVMVGDSFIKSVFDKLNDCIKESTDELISGINIMLENFKSIKHRINDSVDLKPITDEEYNNFLNKIQ